MLKTNKLMEYIKIFRSIQPSIMILDFIAVKERQERAAKDA